MAGGFLRTLSMVPMKEILTMCQCVISNKVRGTSLHVQTLCWPGNRAKTESVTRPIAACWLESLKTQRIWI